MGRSNTAGAKKVRDGMTQQPRGRRSCESLSRAVLETLEQRQMMSAVGALSTQGRVSFPEPAPLYHSRPNAPVTLHLDFTGEVALDWDQFLDIGGHDVPPTLPYTVDSDPLSFNT